MRVMKRGSKGKRKKVLKKILSQNKHLLRKRENPSQMGLKI